LKNEANARNVKPSGRRLSGFPDLQLPLSISFTHVAVLQIFSKALTSSDSPSTLGEAGLTSAATDLISA
jgi:hypothetical protein